jgi:hypothetical protein
MEQQDLQSEVMKVTGRSGFPVQRQSRAEVRRSSVDEIFDFPELARHLAGNKCKGRLTFVSAFKSVESLWHGVDSSPETLHGNLETRHPASIPARQGELRKTQQEPTLRRKVR